VKGRALRLFLIALVLSTVGSLLGPVVSAPAAPLDDKQAEAAQLEQQITENGRRIDALNEQINSAQIALDAANDAITLADTQVAAATAKTKDLRNQLAQRAANVYMQSGSSGGIADLDAKSATDLNSRQKYTSLAAQREKLLVTQLGRAKEDLAARKADAETARAAADTQKQQIESTKAELSDGDAKQRALLSQVKGEIATLVAQQELERKAREAADAAAKFAAAQAQAAATAPASSSGTANTTLPTNIPPPSGKASIAISYAQAQLGKPYCYAGVGPDCYDCSGLTMMAWGAAGVAMPHGSTEQWNMFPHVPLSQAQPGDLIVWDGHVGLYIGGGMMIHAPHTGTVVQVAPVYGTPWGAARPG
jgi:cell wall-associated NlpC family hydrolase